MINKDIIFIADFYLNNCKGGAEFCNDELIKRLTPRSNKKIDCYRSVEVTPQMVEDNKHCFFIVANFQQLSEQTKRTLLDKDYLIYEHDHKYCSTNNPILFPNLSVPEEYLINIDFFRNAKVVFCQSKLHAEVVQKNIDSNNAYNLGCNLWSQEFFNKFEERVDSTPERIRKYGIMQTANRNKGMQQAISYCNKMALNYELIPFLDQDNFFDELQKTETLCFFPQWLESYSRVAIEARLLGCKLITNKYLGAASQPYFNLTGRALLEALKLQQEEVINCFEKAISGEQLNMLVGFSPRVSIITSLYNGEKFISHFLKKITSSNYFENCELIIINANSPQNEEPAILEYKNKFNNIKYLRLEERKTVTETMNLAIEMSSGQYITIANVDDIPAPNHLKTLVKHLNNNPDVDLVYADCFNSSIPNDVFSVDKKLPLYEHSKGVFSPAAMIKCLPGPMPLWRKSLHDKIGMFDERFKFVSDWEFWLRAVEAGSKFLKVNKVLGIYYHNPAGLTTNLAYNKEKREEEKQVFEKYKNVFGEQIYNQYKGYFTNV